MRNQLTNPGEPIRDIYIYIGMDKNWMQDAVQVLYQGYASVTKVLIVENEIAGYSLPNILNNLSGRLFNIFSKKI